MWRLSQNLGWVLFLAEDADRNPGNNIVIPWNTRFSMNHALRILPWMNLVSKPALAAWIVGGIALDQLTKIVARAVLVEGEAHRYLGGVFHIQLVENHGAFLSLGSNLPESLRQAIFLVGVSLLLAGLVAWIFLSRKADGQTRLVMSWIAAGGIGNLIDRALFEGGVTDFLNLGIGSLRTGIFNFADMYITFALAYVVWQSFRKPKATP